MPIKEFPSVKQLISALLAAAIGLPAPAYDRGSQKLAAGNGAASSGRSHALRPSVEGVQAGLEEKLTQRDAAPPAGLEETGVEFRLEQRAFLERWQAEPMEEQARLAGSLARLLEKQAERITNLQRAALIHEIAMTESSAGYIGILGNMGYTPDSLLPLLASSLNVKEAKGSNPSRADIMMAARTFLRSSGIFTEQLIITESDIKRLGLDSIRLSAPGWPETSLVRAPDVEFLNRLLAAGQVPERISSGTAGGLPEIRWGPVEEETAVVGGKPVRIRTYTSFKAASPMAWMALGTQSGLGVEVYRPVIQEGSEHLPQVFETRLANNPPSFFTALKPVDQTALRTALSDSSQTAKDLELDTRAHELGHMEAERWFGKTGREFSGLCDAVETVARLRGVQWVFEPDSLLELLAQFAPEHGFYRRVEQLAEQDPQRAYRLLMLAWLNLTEGMQGDFSHGWSQQTVETQVLERLLEGGPAQLPAKIKSLLARLPFNPLADLAADLLPKLREHVQEPYQLAEILQKTARRGHEILLPPAGLEEGIQAKNWVLVLSHDRDALAEMSWNLGRVFGGTISPVQITDSVVDKLLKQLSRLAEVTVGHRPRAIFVHELGRYPTGDSVLKKLQAVGAPIVHLKEEAPSSQQFAELLREIERGPTLPNFLHLQEPVLAGRISFNVGVAEFTQTMTGWKQAIPEQSEYEGLIQAVVAMIQNGVDAVGFPKSLSDSYDEEDIFWVHKDASKKGHLDLADSIRLILLALMRIEKEGKTPAEIEVQTIHYKATPGSEKKSMALLIPHWAGLEERGWELLTEETVALDAAEPAAGLRVAVQENLRPALAGRFGEARLVTVSNEPEQAARALAELASDGRLAATLLDRMLFSDEMDALRILPAEHGPTFLIFPSEAHLFTPAVAAALLRLNLPANKLFLLKLRQDEFGTYLSVYA